MSLGESAIMLKLLLTGFNILLHIWSRKEKKICEENLGLELAWQLTTRHKFVCFDVA